MRDCSHNNAKRFLLYEDYCLNTAKMFATLMGLKTLQKVCYLDWTAVKSVQKVSYLDGTAVRIIQKVCYLDGTAFITV
jgi:hypothetical protein